MSITEELKAVIEKNLPAQVGDVLRQQLQKGDDAMRERDAAKASLAQISSYLTEAKTEVEKLKAELAKHMELASREAMVSKRENAAEVAELRIRLDAEKVNAEFARGVALGLVRNIEYRHDIHKSDATPVATQIQGGSSFVQPYQTESKRSESQTAT